MINKTKESNWEERFDEEFTQKTDDYNNGQFLGYWQEIEICADDVKLFIQSEIDQALKAQLEQVEEIITKDYLEFIIKNRVITGGKVHLLTADKVIKQIRSELKSKINNLGETK